MKAQQEAAREYYKRQQKEIGEIIVQMMGEIKVQKEQIGERMERLNQDFGGYLEGLK